MAAGRDDERGAPGRRGAGPARSSEVKPADRLADAVVERVAVVALVAELEQQADHDVDGAARKRFRLTAHAAALSTSACRLRPYDAAMIRTPNRDPWGRDLAGTLHELEFESEALAGNPLGDPRAARCYVYTPPGWPDDGPVSGRLVDPGDDRADRHVAQPHARIGATFIEDVDRMIVAGDCRPVVVPDARLLDGLRRLAVPRLGRDRATT